MPRVTDFTLSTNPLGPSHRARSAIRKAIKELHTYPYERIRQLRRYLSNKEQVGEDNILLGRGSSHILTLFLHAFKPTSLVLPAPVSPAHAAFLEKQNVTMHLSPLSSEDGFRFQVERLYEDAGRGDAVFLPNPHDLTGATMHPDQIERLIARVEALDKLLVIDESLMEFARVPSPVTTVARSRNALILRSFSLFYSLAGLRLGYAIGHPDVLRRISDIMEPSPLDTVSVAAAIASLKDKGYVTRTFRFLGQENQYMTERLKRIPTVQAVETAARFLLINTGKSRPAMKPLFLEKGVLIEEFADEQKSRRYIRLLPRRHKENALFLKTLEKIVRSQTTAEE